MYTTMFILSCIIVSVQHLLHLFLAIDLDTIIHNDKGWSILMSILQNLTQLFIYFPLLSFTTFTFYVLNILDS